MTREVVTVAPDQSVSECMNVITEHRVRHLPVVDGSGRPVDIVLRREISPRIWISLPVESYLILRSQLLRWHPIQHR